MSSNIELLNNTLNGGFLSGFVESSVEKPADGLNGECRVHYLGPYNKYEMIVPLVNGVREGHTIIVNDGIPYLYLEYERGLLTGSVERMNDHGIVDLRGYLVNGVERGLFKEYDENEKVVWIGYYHNGQRHSEVRNRFAKQDYCQEDESGEFYELDGNGKVRQLCFYVKGLRHRVIAHFKDGVMTEFDDNEMKVYEGGFKGSIEDGFVREGIGKEYVNGSRVAVYSGDWKNGKRDGLGTEYNGYKPVYRGGWKKGKRNGVGKEMNEEGKVVKSGKWVDGEYQMIVIPSSLTSNPLGVEELRIGENSYNKDSVTIMKLSGLVQLKRIVIGDGCFGKVRVLELEGLNELESVVVGEKCFTHAKMDDDIWSSERSDGSCGIVNCPKLKSIQIGDRSFSDYCSFELKSLPSLQIIDIGVRCFYWVLSFSLTNLPQLQSVKLGECAFCYVQSVVFENLPKLQSIQLDRCALEGDSGYDQQTMSNVIYYLKNRLTLRNLPSLTKFYGDDYNYRYIGSVILENIPQLSSDGIQFGPYCFDNTYSIKSTSTHFPISSSFDATALKSAIRSIGKYV